VDAVAPLQQKKRKKETEKQRLRSHAREEEQNLQKMLSSFESDVKSLRSLAGQIDAYLESNKPAEFAQLTAEIDKILSLIDGKKAQLAKLEPTLDSVKRAVEDQERYKKGLSQNIDILKANERMRSLEKQIDEVTSKLESIEGASTAASKYRQWKEKRDELLQKKATYDGRFSSHVEQIQALQVCANCPSYLFQYLLPTYDVKYL
jgi:chromosome segregation ATPase